MCVPLQNFLIARRSCGLNYLKTIRRACRLGDMHTRRRRNDLETALRLPWQHLSPRRESFTEAITDFLCEDSLAVKLVRFVQ